MIKEQMTLPAEDMAETPIDLIRKLGSVMKERQAQADEKEKELKALQAIVCQIAEVMLPEQMEEAGIADITLSDGTKITLQRFYNAKIPSDRWAEALDWLRENNHDGIITAGFSVKRPKGQSEDVLAARDALCDLGINVDVEDNIHHSTLKAFVREQIESEAELPKELFGVYEGKRVTFKK